jgi:subtilisin family serine protease
MSINARRLAMPWSRPCDLYSAPGRMILKLMLGEAPEAIPASIDVRLGACEAATRIDGGPIDRIIGKFAGRVRVVRVHTSAASGFRAGVGHIGYNDLEHALGLSRTFRIDADHACCIADLVDALNQLDRVESASPYYLCALPFHQAPEAEPDLEQAWVSRDQISASEAMAYEPGDPTVVTAIVDTGVAAEHAELFGRLRPGFDTVELGMRDLANGVQLLGDRTEADTDPEDEVGHGTSCAAIIAARGERIPPGLAGECSVLPMRVLGAAQMTGKAEPVGLGAIPDIDAGMKRAVDLGATVFNMSFGTPEGALHDDDPIPHEDVIRYALAHGCILVAASGNSGKQERFSPACLDGVIAVGAVNAEGKPSSFTTTGDHVALCAPGERVVSAGLHGYQFVTGTSFAAPFVSATAALLVSRARRRSQALDAETTRRLLMESAQPWSSGQGTGLGAGVLDAHAALRRLDEFINRGGDARAVSTREAHA